MRREFKRKTFFWFIYKNLLRVFPRFHVHRVLLYHRVSLHLNLLHRGFSCFKDIVSNLFKTFCLCFFQGMNEIIGPLYYTFASDTDEKWSGSYLFNLFLCFFTISLFYYWNILMKSNTLFPLFKRSLLLNQCKQA